MFRISSLIPAIFVAIIITVITSLYLSSRKEIEALNTSNIALKEELASKDKILQDSLSRLKVRASATQPAQITILPERHEQVQSHEDVPRPENNDQTAKVNTRINSIGKFVPLNENQKQRLKEKFTAELETGSRDTETLEDILGKENADFYREQRKNAFERVLKESIEKEILYIARKLSLAADQEEAFRKAYFEIETEITSNRDNPRPEMKNNASTMEKLVLEEKERNRLLAERMKTILTPDQYQQFIEYESGNQDMQLWHEQ
jgi:hypothetical protein